LRDAREGRGLTQQAVSTRAKWADPEGKGISRTALIAYEAGTSRPGTRELRILCETLSVSPNHLIFGSEEPLKATFPAMEGLSNHAPAIGLNESFQFGLIAAALKGHERDALLSLAMSLAGRALGDERLTGLRLSAIFLSREVEKLLDRQMSSDEQGTGAMSLEDITDRLSRAMAGNMGNALVFDDEGEVVGGKRIYPDPKK
jgi:transcriptional regulator with XRE-family HTH domain